MQSLSLVKINEEGKEATDITMETNVASQRRVGVVQGVTAACFKENKQRSVLALCGGVLQNTERDFIACDRQ